MTKIKNLTSDQCAILVRDKLLNGSLGECIPILVPAHSPPWHLKPLLDLLEKQGRWVECVSVPPRHWKTETIIAGLALAIYRRPHEMNAFASYSADLAVTKANKVRDICERLGVEFKVRRDGWLETKQGGGLFSCGARGSVTGHGVNGIFVVDDPVKDRVEAESPAMREHRWSFVTQVALLRLQDGGRLLVNGTRWHIDDVIGRLISGYNGSDRRPYTKISVYRPDGSVLLPKKFPPEIIDEMKRSLGPYGFAALYEQDPIGRGGKVFGTLQRYDQPLANGKVTIGIDLAYSEDQASDWSVAAVVKSVKGKSGWTHHVIDTVRRQTLAPDFKATIVSLARRHKTRAVHAIVAGPEKGVLDLMRDPAIRITSNPARGDKFSRAQHAGALARDGKILYPRELEEAVGAEMAESLQVIEAFTGRGDRQDDDVDALVAAIEGAENAKGYLANM